MLTIPPDRLSPEALAGLIEEFVTRHGTDLTDIEPKAVQVRRLLDRGDALIVFDEQTESANIVPKDAREEAPKPPAPQSSRVEAIEPRRRSAPARREWREDGVSIDYDEPPPPADE